jgi:hypothetical protein
MARNLPERNLPEVLRFLILPDGSAHAGFSDRSLVVLNPSAVSFVIVHPDGTQSRGLTSCATTAVRSRVVHAVLLRNMLCADAPRLSLGPTSILPATSHFFDSAVPLTSVIWPAAASAQHVVCHLDGAVRVLSVDRLAWLLLHPEGHTFTVCFPVCAGALSDLAEEQRATFPSGLNNEPPPLFPPSPAPAGTRRFVFCTQLHSALADVPGSWTHPLRIALDVACTASRSGGRGTTNAAAAPANAESSGLHEASACGWSAVTTVGWVPVHDLLGLPLEQGSPASTLGWSLGWAINQAMTAAPLPFQLMSAAGHADATLDAAPGGQRVALPSVPQTLTWRLDHRLADSFRALAADPLSSELPENGLRLLLTPHALFRVAPPGDADEMGPLSVTVLEDGLHLMLSSNRRFWESCDAAGSSTVYAVGAVPPSRRCAPVGAPECAAPVSLFELTALGEGLVPLNEQRRVFSAARTEHPARDTKQPMHPEDATRWRERPGVADAGETVEDVHVQGVGRFRLFGDGRVIVGAQRVRPILGASD